MNETMDSVKDKIETKNGQHGANHKEAKDLARGAVVNFLGMVAKVSKVLFVFVAARYYGANALGLYFLAWSTIDIASKLGLIGMDRSIIRDVARYNVDNSEKTRARLFAILRFDITIAFCLSLLVAGLVMILSPAIAELVFKDANLIRPLKIMALALPLVVLSHAFIASTKALRIMRYDALIRGGLEPFILLIGTLALMPLKLGATGLVMAQVFASFVAAATALFVAYRTYRFLGWHWKPLSKKIRKETIRYTSPMAVMDFLDLLVFRMDIMLVGAFLTTTSAGFYGIIVEIISVIKRVRQGFEPIFAPIVSQLFYSKQKERLQRNYVLVTRWLIAGTMLPMTAIVLYPNQILSLFKVISSEAALALVVLALAHGIFGVFSASENLLLMTGRSWLNTLLIALKLLVNGSVAILLIPRLGMVGASLGMLSAFAFVSGVRIYHGYRRLDLNPFSYALLWPLTTAGLTMVLFFFVKNWLTATSVPITALILVMLSIFYVSIYFLGAMQPEERHLIVKLKDKLRRKPAILKA